MIHGAVPSERHHLKVGARHGDTGQSGGKSATEVGLRHLPSQRERCARIDIVPIHIEGTAHRIHVLILLVVFLIVEGFQLHRALIDPLTALGGVGA